MLKSNEEIFITVVASAFLMVLLAIVVVIAIVKYQNRMRKHTQEMETIKNSYQQEILRAQLEMQEQTFLTISQEIHDNIGQVLSLIRLNISTIRHTDTAMAERKINTSKELLDQAIDDLRNLSKRLNTEYVSRQSLSESLTFQLNLIQKTGVYATALEVHGAERDMEPEKKLIVFRIAQEAFNNIIKHARARNIFVTMMYLADELLLKIEDDGAGFEADNLSSIEISQKGIGIYNMYYRAGLIGGRFSIQSQPGKGTVAQLTLPLSY